MMIAIALTACGAPSAAAPDAITMWRTTVQDHINQINTTTTDMGVQMLRYYEDDVARQRVDEDLDTVQAIHQQLVALTPPPSRQGLHALVLDATKDCSTAMDSYRAAFATNNANEDAPKRYALLQRCRAKLDRLRKKDIDL